MMQINGVVEDNVCFVPKTEQTANVFWERQRIWENVFKFEFLWLFLHEKPFH